MRRITLIVTLFLAGCATRPQQPQPTQASAPAPRPANGMRLLGLSAAELSGIFGRPALQVPEGNSIKLQYRGSGCVLDAYLYPSSGGMRVTHVDARATSGAQTDAAACANALAGAS